VLPAELENLDRLWQRESVLLPVALAFDAQEIDGASPQMSAMHRWLARGAGLFFVKSRDVVAGMERPSLAIDVDKPTPAEERVLWLDQFGDDPCIDADQLAGQFRFNAPAIVRIARAVQATGAEGPERQDVLWAECLSEARPRLDRLAQRIEPKATWDDIVLPEEETALLHQIADQVRGRGRVYDDWGFRERMNRGLGISALFAGESGSGKTMAAEVIANDLRLNLYRIDLSAVVSKYIGETEKNLRQLFDAAEDGGTILLFDEADALFGKRSEVKDSHDRYANIEVNYLLQRMEAFSGLAILATNMKSALDTAFLRRLRFLVTFPFPGVRERRKIWEHAFPATAPVGVLDYGRLAAFNLPGGSITNIALNAAFLAARKGGSGKVDMPGLLAAIRAEQKKLDRPINEAAFKLAGAKP
jgi:AAA+ superfamily predicted ATPase